MPLPPIIEKILWVHLNLPGAGRLCTYLVHVRRGVRTGQSRKLSLPRSVRSPKTVPIQRSRAIGPVFRSRTDLGIKSPYAASARLPNCRSIMNIAAGESPTILSCATMSLAFFSSSTCSPMNHWSITWVG